MILTNCAACAAPLPRLAKQCSRCQTRYCHATCQQDHWRRGHKQMCKKIFRGGGAEKYHADKKYKEAVAEAVEASNASDRTDVVHGVDTHQLDWSLDDLELDSTERQIVDRVLAEYSTPDFKS